MFLALSRPLMALSLTFALTPSSAFGQPADSTSRSAVADSTRVPGAVVPSSRASGLGERLAADGFENVTVSDSDGGAPPRVALENRRYLHVCDALGHQDQVTGPGVTSFQRRLGLVAAAISDPGEPRASVAFPSDPHFPEPPAGSRLADTRRSLDLVLRPLLTYELGRVFDPVLIRIEMEPEAIYNPWPGARATASVVLPLRNDFEEDARHPDLNRVRPGPTTLEQYAWIPRVALVTGTAGLFADNRYGLSFGAARPLLRGDVLLDGQIDVTGSLAFTSNGFEYSEARRWTGFGGVTWRPPAYDLAVRLRAARFLYGDHGVELELRRALGNLELAFFGTRTESSASTFTLTGVRVLVPIPPFVRPTGRPVRVLPVAQLPLEYRDEAEPAGRYVQAVASREDFLRQLSATTLRTNLDRYRAARDGAPPPAEHLPTPRVSLTGMSGFINTPWAGVLPDRALEAGYNTLSREGAYDHRGQYRNDVYYAAFGFLPHLETGLRWTVIPGLRAFTSDAPDSRVTDSDRMLSARLELLAPRPGRPGAAIGIEDARGTRRFHSTYALTGMPFSYRGLNFRLALGYAPTVLTAARHVLDGGFGAFEVSAWRPVALTLEQDSEKWNGGLAFDLGFGFRVRAALLDMKHLAAGAGWTHTL